SHEEHNHDTHEHSASCTHDHEGHDHDNDHKQNETLAENTIDTNLKYKFYWAIINHNIPITLVLSALFISFGFSFRRSIGLISVFALAAPLGAILGIYLLKIEGLLH